MRPLWRRAAGLSTSGKARAVMGFGQWLRSNSEHYLLIDAQRRIAQRHGAREPSRPRGLRDRFWMQVFAPVYRMLPWSVRRLAIRALPGSHRRDWPAAPPPSRSRRPAV